ncbi:uncharacterized protein LOC141588501 [Silene latifolia]|uniref:uncharacterized protein LOC141588501 n=1 Tax=Silene latifolia TaxID=37657 RepID=UPI003D76B4AB
MEFFQECVSLCAMEDIKATGALYTWSNKQAPADRVYSRLDRAMGNQEWMELYGDYVAHFHPEGMFDQCPCTVVDKNIEIGGRRSFKYFNMWGKADSFLSYAAAVWGRSYSGTKMFSLIKKLKALKPVLKGLNRSCFSDIENSSSIASALLESIQKQIVDEPGNFDLIQQEMELSAELKGLISARDSFLTQKAKIQWSIEGDLNTYYFHQAIRMRIMMNKVLQIEDMHGKLCILGDDIQNALLSYYQDLLGTTTVTDHVSLSVVRRGSCCTTEHWEILNRPATVEEIKHSIFSIPKSKSPGPDGFNSQFYRDAWEIVGEEVCVAIANFFSTGKLLNQINSTVITLIPKVDRPTSVKHFRPISCCNVIYKSISKILCSRLALVLRDIISRNQGAFVKGRSILENILICQDLVRLYSRGMASPRYVNSIMLLLRALATFSATSGLRVNATKSEVVFNGVAPGLKQDITEISGFTEGMLPFKYVGVPIQAGRLTKTDCNVLIEKIVLRVRSIGARKLSYAGRLVLINSVFNTLHNYWASIFLIPKGVIKRIEQKRGGTGYQRGWVWNVANVGKLVNWIYTKADRLWVLWIDHVYMKGTDWDNYHPPQDSNWNWRNICKMGVTVDDNCVMCEGGPETYCHLFTDCIYSKQILAGLENWLQRKLIVSSGDCSKLQYQMERNDCRLKLKLRCPAQVIRSIKKQVKGRVKQKLKAIMQSRDRQWLASIDIIV